MRDNKRMAEGGESKGKEWKRGRKRKGARDSVNEREKNGDEKWRETKKRGERENNDW